MACLLPLVRRESYFSHVSKTQEEEAKISISLRTMIFLFKSVSAWPTIISHPPPMWLNLERGVASVIRVKCVTITVAWQSVSQKFSQLKVSIRLLLQQHLNCISYVLYVCASAQVAFWVCNPWLQLVSSLSSLSSCTATLKSGNYHYGSAPLSVFLASCI